MIRRFPLTIGLIIALLPAGATAAEAPPVTGLYTTLLQMTKMEQSTATTELAIQRAIPALLSGQTPFPVEEEHVEMALTNRFISLCANAEQELDVTYTQCMEVGSQIVALAKREAWVRSLGRDLELIATSYEPEADGHTGRKHELSVKLPAAMYWWQSGSDRATNPVQSTKVRLMEIDRDEFESHVDALNGALTGLIQKGTSSVGEMRDIGDVVAALHRYKHGYFSVQQSGGDDRGNCCSSEEASEEDGCNSDEGAGGGELGQLSARWCDIEDELHAAWEKLPHDKLQDIEEGEIVVFPVLDLEVDGIPEVVLWLRADDAGLLWGMPLEPVLPGIVPGGQYAGSPGSPPEDGGICSHAFGKRGYLCRAQEIEDCPIDMEPPEDDEEEEDPIGGKIELTACVPHWFDARRVESGANACEIGAWKMPIDPQKMQADDTPKLDNKLRVGTCDNCIPDFVCEAECVDTAAAATFPKDADGKIKICIKQDQTKYRFEYLFMHELVHAQQICGWPIDEPFNLRPDAASCCTSEYYPHVVSCKAMIEDGVIDGKIFGVEECALMLANLSCPDWEFACTGEPPDEDAYREKEEKLLEMMKRPEDENPQACANAVRAMDPRALALKETLKLSCTPGCETEYENTIGNNLCYISQCVEESLEAHRLIPGRIPYVTQDEAFPWDSCLKDRSEIPDLVAIPPLTRTFIPPYRGRELVEQLDMLLCQVSALPRLSPPVLCSFHPTRRNNLPLRTYADTISSFLEMNTTSALRTEDVRGSAQNIGTRIGTVMYQQYLHKSMREFSDLVRAANGLIHAIGETTLPSTACPRNHTGDCGIFQ
jgi:hypothetical protein